MHRAAQSTVNFNANLSLYTREIRRRSEIMEIF